ncbi:AAT-domain-containing protein [Irpex rosettiformis]|uniref:AAT-domain-containing protein n=1 Tax=Irpex rosettiformis TaxID=378272 RepID=A0ACB8U991_9APHY|nr:AAT-domain-containing protein [Irpex rosettiformis]
MGNPSSIAPDTGVDIARVDLKGTPYEESLSHGTLLRTQILDQLHIYRGIFQTTCKFDWARVRSVASEYHETIARLVPDYLEEMRGIADGVGTSEVDILDIVALNARSEIALGQWDDGCTALSWKLENKQILAQNWDWRTSVGKNLALASICQDDKPDIWMVIEPGIIGKIGFNSSSVGVCLNAIRARPIDTRLLPIHLLLRAALESTSASVAIARIEELGGASSSQHILIADSNGGIGLELSPRGGVYLKENLEGVIVHTNHFLENKLVNEPPWLSGSSIRLNRAYSLCELLSKNGGEELSSKVTPDALRRTVFADTFNSPQAICCVPDPSRPESVETLFNIVMTFEKGKFPRAEVLMGRPASCSRDDPVYIMPW